jgi:hypothetical protein
LIHAKTHSHHQIILLLFGGLGSRWLAVFVTVGLYSRELCYYPLVGCENVPETTVQNTHIIVVTAVVVYDGKQQSTLSDV